MANKTVRILRDQDIEGIWYRPNQLVDIDAEVLKGVPAASYDAAKKAVDYLKSQGVTVRDHNPKPSAAAPAPPAPPPDESADPDGSGNKVDGADS